MIESFDVRRIPQEPRKRRGVVLLPSLCTMGNMFCGYACVVYAMRGDLVTAAPFVGFAIVLDMLDGRLARLTNTTSAFGVEFDSLADVISFGVAPAVLAYAWGLSELGRVGWAAGFMYVAAAAMRLARFNAQAAHQLDKRYFIGMPTPAAAGVVAATIYAWPYPVTGYPGCGDRHGRARARGPHGQRHPLPQLQDDQLRLGPARTFRCWASRCSSRSSRPSRGSRCPCSRTAICSRRSSSSSSRG